LVFAVIVCFLFVGCGRWPEAEPELHAATQEAARSDIPGRRFGPAFVAAVGVLLAGIAPLSARSFYTPSAADASTARQPEAPRIASPWTIVDSDAPDWRPRYVDPSAEFVETYELDNHVVKLYVAYYRPDLPGVKLASTANALFDSPWWESGRELNRVSQEGQSFQVRETSLEGSSSSLVVWSWYSINGTFTGNDYLAKLLLAKARLLRSPVGSAAIVVATEDRPGVDPTSLLRDFVAHLSIPAWNHQRQRQLD
jgi:EpsI family protein